MLALVSHAQSIDAFILSWVCDFDREIKKYWLGVKMFVPTNANANADVALVCACVKI